MSIEIHNIHDNGLVERINEEYIKNLNEDYEFDDIFDSKPNIIKFIMYSEEDINYLGIDTLNYTQNTNENEAQLSKEPKRECFDYNILKKFDTSFVNFINFQFYLYYKDGKYNRTFDEYPMCESLPMRLLTEYTDLEELKCINIANIRFANLDRDFYSPEAPFIKFVKQLPNFQSINFYNTNVDRERVEKLFEGTDIYTENTICYIN